MLSQVTWLDCMQCLSKLAYHCSENPSLFFTDIVPNSFQKSFVCGKESEMQTQKFLTEDFHGFGGQKQRGALIWKLQRSEKWEKEYALPLWTWKIDYCMGSVPLTSI